MSAAKAGLPAGTHTGGNHRMYTYLLVTAIIVGLTGVNLVFKGLTKRLEAQIAREAPSPSD